MTDQPLPMEKRTDRRISEELQHLAKIIYAGPVETIEARHRAATLCNEAARRIRYRNFRKEMSE